MFKFLQINMHQDKNNKTKNKQPIQTKNWDFSQLTLKIGLVGDEQQKVIIENWF